MSERIIEELRQVKEALKKERENEEESFKNLLLQTPLNKRVETGASWYPLNIERSGFGLGEYPFIEAERTKQLDKPHKFRSGSVVSLFSESDSGKASDKNEVKGVVNWVMKNRIKITLYGDDMPDWIGNGKIGINISFDERSYKEMDRAMDKVISAKKSEKSRLAHLREVIYGAENPDTENEAAIKFRVPYLNDSQNSAIRHILAANDVALVHGPPGTGKTTTLVHAVAAICEKEKNVLVCAPSNPSVDLLTERLAEQGLNVVRIGNISRVDESILKHTVEGKMQNRPEMEEVKRMKIEAAMLRKKVGQYKRSFGEKEREERKAAREEAKMVIQHARMLEDYVVQKILNEADVICCTLIGALDSYIEKRNFKTLIIDESAQALEPAAWVAISKCDRVIFAGDPFQLPPTVKSQEAIKSGLAVTLMEKALKKLPDARMLDVQYRMNEMIMNFSNHQFYNDKLHAAEFVKYRTLLLKEGDSHPLQFIDTAGCGFEETINPQTLSRFNKDEYKIIRLHLDDILARAEKPYSVGIISPYREQVNYLQEIIKEEFTHFPEADITIDTIDSFQGQERDIIYISLVRSNDKQEIGFLSDTRRMNVAMTRAKMKLIIIGDSATIGNHPFYKAMLDYCEKNEAYHTGWEYM